RTAPVGAIVTSASSMRITGLDTGSEITTCEAAGPPISATIEPAVMSSIGTVNASLQLNFTTGVAHKFDLHI
ncbi:hypothetical protein, partial [uncultured Ruegeria sp.]|uniref:hypothetical protein n=1 Tax=uncultured Ruegeria sp. TaxID=259304 RepID=UPI002635C5DD